MLKLSNTLENWTPGVSSTTDRLTMGTLHRTLSSLQSCCFLCLKREWISDHPSNHLSMYFAFVWSFSTCRFDGRKRSHVSALEWLPSSAQSFRLLSLLFFTFSFNIVNSGGSPCIIKTLSQPCFCFQKGRTPQRLPTCCCPTPCAMIVGIKIKSFENEVKVLQCFAPSQFNDPFISIPPSLLLFQLWQHLQSVEQIPAVARGVCLPWLSAGQQTSAALWPAAHAGHSLNLEQPGTCVCHAWWPAGCTQHTQGLGAFKAFNFSDIC